MKRFLEILNEVKMTATGSEGQRHARQYLTNPETATYVTASKADHIPAGEKVNVHSHHYDDKTNTTYATISHSSEPNKKITVPISKLHKPMERASGHGRRKAEDTAVAHLHNQITSSKIPVKIKDRNGTTHHIVGAAQVKGNPKADIALVNDKGEHVFHISHKKSETSHQGYGAFNAQRHANNTTVQEFGRRLKKEVGEGGSLKGKSRTMDLKHDNSEHSNMIKTALFGTNHSSKKSGIENVDEIHHGAMNLKMNVDGTHSIESEKKIDRSNYKKQKYELVAKNAPDRHVPSTKIKGILGLWARGQRKGKDVKKMNEEFILRGTNV